MPFLFQDNTNKIIKRIDNRAPYRCFACMLTFSLCSLFFLSLNERERERDMA